MSNQLTSEQKSRYIDSPNHCPYCDSDRIQSGDRESDENIMTWEIRCHACKQEWTDVYTLTNIRGEGIPPTEREEPVHLYVLSGTDAVAEYDAYGAQKVVEASEANELNDFDVRKFTFKNRDEMQSAISLLESVSATDEYSIITEAEYNILNS